jgi:hypothetical protein
MVRQRYMNLSGKSSVIEFEIKPSTMIIKFSGVGYGRFGKKNIYTYEKKRIGIESFHKMIELAIRGKGLNTFINKNKPVWSMSTFE